MFTCRYLREPLQLPYGETVFLKWGSNVVSLKAKRSIRHRISNLVGRRATVGVASLFLRHGFSIVVYSPSPVFESACAKYTYVVFPDVVCANQLLELDGER